MISQLVDYRDKATLAILALILLSAIFLAWSATLSLCGLFQPRPKEPLRFAIYVSGSTQNLPRDTHDEVSIVRLVVDGHRARPGDLRLKGSWEPGWDWATQSNRRMVVEESDLTSWPRRAGWAARLNHPNTAETASISFSGKSAAVLFDRGHQCGHLSNSIEGRKIWQDACPHLPGSTNSLVAVDLPIPATPSRWSFALWLTVCLIVVAAVRPWIDNTRTELWLVAYLIVLHFLVWSTQCVGLIIDTLSQIPTLKLNAQGWPAYCPPGYPLLVGFGYLISATYAGSIITLIQHAMMVATILWCFRLLQRCVARPLALLTALATGAAAPTLFLPQAIMSENVALFGMAGALYFAYRGCDVKHYGIISGLLLGWAGMARIVPLAAGIPAILLVMLSAEPVMAGIKRFGAVLAVAAATVLVPSVWFGSRSGSFALASSIGHHMYNRVITDQFLLDPSAPATAYFLHMLYPVNPEGKPHWETQALLKKKGLDYWEIETLMRRVSWEGICRTPWQFIVFSFRQSWTQYFDNPTSLVPWWSVPDKYTVELESPPILKVHASGLLWRERLEQQFATAWTLLPWLALGGLVSLPFLRQKLGFLSFAVIPFGYIVASSFVEFEYARYTVTIIPFIFCLAAGPFAAVATLLRTRKGDREAGLGEIT